MDEKFGFYIDVKTEGGEWKNVDGKSKYVPGPPNGEYEVALPHSCDQWSIAWGTKEKTIAELERFIAEAQEILEELKAKRTEKIG